MGLFRLLYDNKITAESMITVSSLRLGLVSSALKEGSGSATLNPAGNYTAQTDKEYVIEIDSVAAGKEIGQATFKWSDGAGGWNATGVATSTLPTALNNGVTVSFTAGTGNDFELADAWYFKAFNMFKPGNMIDLSRDARYRSKELESPNMITLDLGTAKEIKAFILYDHNLTSAATITLEGDAAATFNSGGGGLPQFSEAVTWNADKILHYLSAATTKRHWRIKITDALNLDTYIEIGELFLGAYLELTKNMAPGVNTPIKFVIGENTTPYGVKRRRFFNLSRSWIISVPLLPSADIALLTDMLEDANSRATGNANPFFYNDDSAAPGNTWLVEIAGMDKSRPLNDYQSIEMTMNEVLKSV